jgi:hypothetical protein
MKTKSISNKLIQSLFHSFPKIMKHLKLYHLLFLLSFTLFSSCNKEITEPEHKNNGSNVLYFEVDGKGYLLQDKSFGLKTKKTGEIFVGDDKKSLPLLNKFVTSGAWVYTLDVAFSFDKQTPDAKNFGNFTIEFSNVNGIIKCISFYNSCRFFSPKHNKHVDLSILTLSRPPTLIIDNFDEKSTIVSGEIVCQYLDQDPNEVIDFRIYFDVEVNNI